MKFIKDMMMGDNEGQQDDDVIKKDNDVIKKEINDFFEKLDANVENSFLGEKEIYY